MRINFNPIYNNNFYKTKQNLPQKQTNTFDLKDSKALECMAIYNQISFGNKPIPLYVMDYWGEYQKFDSILEASIALDVTQGHILKTLRDDGSVLVDGFAVDYAKNIEAQDENGDLIPQDDKLLALTSKFSNGLNMPIYKIDYSGKIERFNNSKETKEKYGLESIFINGKRNSKTGFFFIGANELEIRNQKGKIRFDIFGKPDINYDKLYQILYDIAHSSSMPIYLIDKNKKATRYESAKIASEKTGISQSSINAALSGSKNTVHEYVVVNAFDVEKRDEKCQVILDKKGNPVLDDNEVFEAIQKFKRKRQRSLTLFNPETNETLYFDSPKEASVALNVTRSAISNALNREGLRVKGYIAQYN